MAIYYFAYGSNINYYQLKNRIRAILPVIHYESYIKDFKLVFDVNYKEFYYANVEFEPGETVTGITYKITPHQLLILNCYERNYYSFNTFDSRGNIVYVYKSRQPSISGTPKPEYMAKLNMNNRFKNFKTLRNY